MKIRDIKPDDFTNYKKCSLFIGMGTCNWKCCIEDGVSPSICQNNALAKTTLKSIDAAHIISNYFLNSAQEAVVLGGLEPLDDMESVKELAREWNKLCKGKDFVIYTGYDEWEVASKINKLRSILEGPLIVKYGRFHLNGESRFDVVLGVTLASSNQFAVRYDAKQLGD